MNGCNQADEHSNLYQRWWPCHRWVKKFGHHSTIPSNFPFLGDSRWQRTCHYSLVTASWSPANCWQSLREYASQPENWPFVETGAGLSLYTFIVTQNYIEAALISPWGTPTKLLLEKIGGTPLTPVLAHRIFAFKHRNTWDRIQYTNNKKDISD